MKNGTVRAVMLGVVVALALVGIQEAAIRYGDHHRDIRQRQEHRDQHARARAEIESRLTLGAFDIVNGRGEDDVIDRAGWSKWANTHVRIEELHAKFWRLNRGRKGVHDPLREGDIVVFPLYHKK